MVKTGYQDTSRTDYWIEMVAAETKEVDGILVPVATPSALYRLKKDTLRPLDRQDAEALRRRFDLAEE